MRTRYGAMAAASCLALSGCGLFGSGDKEPSPIGTLQPHGETETVAFADGAGLYLPPTLAGYTRLRVTEAPKGHDIAAEYRRGDGADEILAAIRMRSHPEGSALVPFSGGGKVATVAASGAASAQMISALRAREADLAAGPVRHVFLLRFGVLQAGTQTVLQGPSGQRVVEAFCCVNGTWLYGFEFAVPQGADAARTADDFVHAIAWSSDPKASVDPIEQ